MKRPACPWQLFTGAAVGTLLLASCANDEDAAGEVPSDVAVYVSTPGSVGGDAAQLQGTLVLDDGCSYVVDANGDRWLPIFASTSVTSSDGALLYGEDRYTYDQDVTLAGGESALLDSDAIPDSCSTELLWRVTQPPE